MPVVLPAVVQAWCIPKVCGATTHPVGLQSRFFCHPVSLSLFCDKGNITLISLCDDSLVIIDNLTPGRYIAEGTAVFRKQHKEAETMY